MTWGTISFPGKNQRRFFSHTFFSVFIIVIFVPISAHATSSIARNVVNFCAPNPTMPDVGSCSACHSSANPSVNDLTAAGQWAVSPSTFSNFCPAAATPPPAPTPTPTPPPAGMSPGNEAPPATPGMGGTGASVDDDDDEAEVDDDDDDASVGASISRALRALRSRLIGG